MKVLRKLLLPIVPIYFLVTWIRNLLYDLKIKKSESYDFPVIAVGNLSVGGTGKTPMVEFLIRLLDGKLPLATLSRGYKRDTTGFHLVKPDSTAKQVGDEPLQFKTKFPNVIVSVDADRKHGIAMLRSMHPIPEVIILDDAYQHRKIEAGFYILLTAYSNLYIDDIVLPTGNLREPRKGADRASVVIITKCPKDIKNEECAIIADKLSLCSHQTLYFSTISYNEQLIGINEQRPVTTLQDQSFVLITGIADPKPLVTHYKNLGLQFEHLEYPDHHNFTEAELKKLQIYKCIVTTEKDYLRLKPYFLSGLWYQPMTIKFIKEENIFVEQVLNFVDRDNF